MRLRTLYISAADLDKAKPHVSKNINLGDVLNEYMYVSKYGMRWTHRSEARFLFKRNCLRCVRCVNENHKKRKRLRWQAVNHGCHCFDRAFLLAGACKRLSFLRFSFTQRTQRTQYASDCVWMKTRLDKTFNMTLAKTSVLFLRCVVWVFAVETSNVGD